MNFDTSRATKSVEEVVVTADRPLPAFVTKAQLNFDALITRSGSTLESTDFPPPTFSQPKISPDRQSITFTICLTPQSIPAGQYVGGVTISGPPGLSATSVSLTINAKVDRPFYLFSAISLVASFLLLVVKDAAAWRGK